MNITPLGAAGVVVFSGDIGLRGKPFIRDVEL